MLLNAWTIEIPKKYTKVIVLVFWLHSGTMVLTFENIWIYLLYFECLPHYQWCWAQRPLMFVARHGENGVWMNPPPPWPTLSQRESETWPGSLFPELIYTVTLYRQYTTALTLSEFVSSFNDPAPTPTFLAFSSSAFTSRKPPRASTPSGPHTHTHTHTCQRW